MSHSQAAHVFQDSNLEPDNDSETGSEDESTHPFTAAPVEEDGDGEDRAKLYTHTVRKFLSSNFVLISLNCDYMYS